MRPLLTWSSFSKGDSRWPDVDVCDHRGQRKVVDEPLSQFQVALLPILQLLVARDSGLVKVGGEELLGHDVR